MPASFGFVARVVILSGQETRSDHASLRSATASGKLRCVGAVDAAIDGETVHGEALGVGRRRNEMSCHWTTDGGSLRLVPIEHGARSRHSRISWTQDVTIGEEYFG